MFDPGLYAKCTGYWHLSTFRTESYKRVLISYPQRLLCNTTKNDDYVITHICVESCDAGLSDTYFMVDIDHILPKL